MFRFALCHLFSCLVDLITVRHLTNAALRAITVQFLREPKAVH